MRKVLCAVALTAWTTSALANCPPGAICPSGNAYDPGPAIYDQNGDYHGRLSSNPYMPDSTANPYGQYGNRYSPDSFNNPNVQQRFNGR